MNSIIIVLGYVVIVLLIGVISSRKKGIEQYMLAGRRVSAIPLAASLCAGLVGGGVLISTAALSFTYGMGFMWFYIGSAFAFFTFPLFSQKIIKSSRIRRFYTISDYISHIYGKTAGVVSSIVIFSAFFSLILVQFIAGGIVLSSIISITYTTAVMISGVIVFLYLFLGGFNAVIKTDLFQYLVMIVLSAGLYFFLSGDGRSIGSVLNIGVGQAIAFFLFGAIPIYTQADIWQRAYSARNSKALKIGFTLAGILLLIFGFLIGVLGSSAYNLALTGTANKALTASIENLIPISYSGLVMVFLFSSIMSTLDTALLVSATNISNDLLCRSLGCKRKFLVKNTKLSVFVLSLLGLVFALMITDIISTLFALVSLALCLAPSLILGLWFRLKSKAVVLSISSGFVSACMMVAFGVMNEETGILVLPVSLLFLILGQILLKGKEI